MAVSDEIKLRCRAPHTAVILRSRALRLDFSGECTIRDGSDLVDLHVVADLPDAGGAEDGGSVTVSGGEGRWTATIEQPGGITESIAKSPLGVHATGQRWQLTGAADFVLVSDTVATTLRIEDMVLETERPG